MNLCKYLRNTTIICLHIVATLSVCADFQIISVNEPVSDGRWLPIQSVTYNINDNTVVQNTEALTSSVSVQNQPVYVTEVVAFDGVSNRTLDIFNFEGAVVRDVNGVVGQTNVQTSHDGLGVISWDGNDFVNTNAGDGVSAFNEQVVQSTQTNDILNYIYYDGANTSVPGNEFEILFSRGLETNDAMLIQERYGNTYFALTPLGADGEPIPDANVLIFGGDTEGQLDQAVKNGSNHSRYDWNTGYAASAYQSSQTVGFTVSLANQFFEGTSVPVEERIVFGFQVNNEGNADVKFFGLSDDPFTNNPPNLLLIPEPSAANLTFLLLLSLTIRTLHNRRKRS